MTEPLTCCQYYRDMHDGRVVHSIRRCDRPATYTTASGLKGVCGIHARATDLPIQPTTKKEKATTNGS